MSITLIYGKEKSGKSLLISHHLRLYKGTKILIADKADYLSSIKKVLIKRVKDYSELKEAISYIKKLSERKNIDILAIDSITDIYRREYANQRGLAECLDLLSKLKINILITSDMYEDFETKELKIPAKGILFYFSDNIAHIEKVNSNTLKLKKIYPKSEEVFFKIKDTGELRCLKEYVPDVRER
jgi:archaellum biogenesis ATPase FlaH